MNGLNQLEFNLNFSYQLCLNTALVLCKLSFKLPLSILSTPFLLYSCCLRHPFRALLFICYTNFIIDHKQTNTHLSCNLQCMILEDKLRARDCCSPLPLLFFLSTINPIRLPSASGGDPTLLLNPIL